ncbi:MAG TPA: serine hydrolase domain-containing protein [Sphingobacteriaceae bacterium]
MKAFVIMILGTLLSVSATAQLTEKLDDIINKNVKAGGPGIALHIETGGKTIYNNGFGLANTETTTPITPATNFRMASVSKQFTAMAILLLEKDGKLSLEDQLAKYLPEIPSPVGEKVLLRHLLTHSSGLIDYEALMDENIKQQLLDADILKILEKQDTTYFEPGSRFRYSNSAYCLMTLIVERVSGQNYPAFIEQRIFKPLNMASSRVYQTNAQIPNRAMGYATDKNGKVYFSDQSLTSATKGDGGVYTSLTDYAKWSAALRNNTLINLSAVSKRLNYEIAELPDSYYNAGWFLDDSDKTTFFHSGSTCGFSTFSIQIPEQQVSIVYFSNLANNEKPFRDIMDILAEMKIVKPGRIMSLHTLTR